MPGQEAEKNVMNQWDAGKQLVRDILWPVEACFQHSSADNQTFRTNPIREAYYKKNHCT
jgi:hypothetical protein